MEVKNGCPRQGACKECKSNNLEYGELVFDDSGGCYKYTCGDCGHEGMECYDFDYDPDEST